MRLYPEVWQHLDPLDSDQQDWPLLTKNVHATATKHFERANLGHPGHQRHSNRPDPFIHRWARYVVLQSNNAGSLENLARGQWKRRTECLLGQTRHQSIRHRYRNAPSLLHLSERTCKGIGCVPKGWILRRNAGVSSQAGHIRSNPSCAKDCRPVRHLRIQFG